MYQSQCLWATSGPIISGPQDYVSYLLFVNENYSKIKFKYNSCSSLHTFNKQMKQGAMSFVATHCIVITLERHDNNKYECGGQNMKQISDKIF